MDPLESSLQIVLRPRNGKWQAEASYTSCATYSKVSSIQAVVAELRNKRGAAHARITLKVEEGTTLTGVDVLAIIEANGGPNGLDLSRCRMHNLDLDYETIQEERETYAEREGAIPPWANYHNGGVSLEGAKLQGAGLEEARLRGANLSRADLRGARLGGADLQGADLSMAKMQNTKLNEKHLIANLRGASLWEAQLQGANLFRVDLREVANLRYAQLRGSDLRGARLEAADLYDVASLAGAHLYGAYLDRTRLRRDQLGDAVGEEIGARDKSYREASEALEEVFSSPEEGLWLESGNRKSAQNLPKMQPNEETFLGSTYETAAETYLNLKNNFASIGRYEDAAWAHTKERQMKKLGYFQEWRWKRPGTWINLFLWARNWLYELSARATACSCRQVARAISSMRDDQRRGRTWWTSCAAGA